MCCSCRAVLCEHVFALAEFPPLAVSFFCVCVSVFCLSPLLGPGNCAYYRLSLRVLLVVMMRRRPQPGDALICFDGCSVEGGKRPLGTIFDPKRNPHELVIRRKLKPAPAAPAGGKGKAPPLPPPIRFSCNVAAVDDPSDKDKKGVAAKMLPFALDKKGAIVSLGGPSESKGHPSVIDELMIGDVVVSVDGKKWSGPVEMRAKAQKLDAKGSGNHVVVVDRPPMFISPEQYREMSGDVPAPTQVSTTQPPKAPPPPPPCWLRRQPPLSRCQSSPR